MGGLRLRLRRGLGLGLNRNLNPRNREKVLATLYPPLAEDNEEADLDGGLYARKKSKSGTHSIEGASDSRRNRSSASRTSASASDRAHHISQSTLPPQPLPKSKHSQSRSRSNTSSQSPSLPSPSSPAFSDAHTQAQIVSPSTIEQGQGFFDLEDELPVRSPGRIGGDNVGGFPVARIGAPGGSGFPITGFASARSIGGGGRKRSSDFGAFLARRGDEEGERWVAEDGV